MLASVEREEVGFCQVLLPREIHLEERLLDQAYTWTPSTLPFLVVVRVPPPLVFPHPLFFPKGGGGASLARPKIFHCSSLRCCGRATTQEGCPKHSSGKW